MKTLLITLALCLSLCACAPERLPGGGTQTEAPQPGGSQSEEPQSGGETARPAAPSLDPDEEPTVLTCRIVDGAEDGNLLLAELGEGLYGGAGVYRLSLARGGPKSVIIFDNLPAGDPKPGPVPVFLDGQPAEASALEDGMTVEVAFNGFVAETFPAGLGEAYSVTAWSRGQEKNPMGAAYDLCGLYLQVLEDLWQKDPALNEHIDRVALDLSRAPGGLTDSERAALVWRFGELHDTEAFPATFDELKAGGTIIAEPLEPDSAVNRGAYLHWPDGCFFSITASEGHDGESYSLPTLFFDAEKWRSSTGAYIFHNCTASWGENTSWSYRTGSEMIA